MATKTKKKWPPEFTRPIREKCARCDIVQPCRRKWYGIVQGLPFCVDEATCSATVAAQHRGQPS